VAVNGDYAYVADGYAGLRIHQFYGGGVEETPYADVRNANPMPTVVRGLLRPEPVVGTSSSLSWLLDATGRKVLDMQAGANDVSHLSPGVYFVRLASGVARNAPSVRKVIVTR
jgi:hypothetical protein